MQVEHDDSMWKFAPEREETTRILLLRIDAAFFDRWSHFSKFIFILGDDLNWKTRREVSVLQLAHPRLSADVQSNVSQSDLSQITDV